MRTLFIIIIIINPIVSPSQTKYKSSIHLEIFGSHRMYNIGYEHSVKIINRISYNNLVGISLVQGYPQFNYDTGLKFGNFNKIQINTGVGITYGTNLFYQYQRFERRNLFPHLYLGLEILEFKDQFSIEFLYYGGYYYLRKPNSISVPQFLYSNDWFLLWGGLKLKYNFGLREKS